MVDNMDKARIAIVLVGIVLPFIVVEIIEPGSTLALLPPQSFLLCLVNLGSFMFFNMAPWGSLLLLSLLYRHPISLLLPALCGYADLAVNYLIAPPEAIGLVIMVAPMATVFSIAIGGVAGFVLDRCLTWRLKHAEAK